MIVYSPVAIHTHEFMLKQLGSISDCRRHAQPAHFIVGGGPKPGDSAWRYSTPASSTARPSATHLGVKCGELAAQHPLTCVGGVERLCL